jgi:hypothetical protein
MSRESIPDQDSDQRFRRLGERDQIKTDPSLRENFPFRIFVKDEYLQEGLASRSERDEIIKLTGIESIHMDSKINVPEVPGQAMIIESRTI